MMDPAPVVRVQNREVSANTYLCRTGTPGECLVIDPGTDRDAIDAALADEGLTPVAIFCSHGHFDHLGSAEHLRRKYAIPVHLHADDVKVARNSNFRMMAMNLPTRIDVPELFTHLHDGEAWRSGDDRVEVTHVPGHTPGSVVIRFGGHAFTGDTVYRNETWRMRWPEEDEGRLVASLRGLWADLPEDSMVHPGHGSAATFGEIKRSNEPLRRLLGVERVPFP